MWRWESRTRPVYFQYKVIHNLVRFQIGRNQQTTISHFTQNGLTDEIYTLSHELVSNLFYDRVLDNSVTYATVRKLVGHYRLVTQLSNHTQPSNQCPTLLLTIPINLDCESFVTRHTQSLLLYIKQYQSIPNAPPYLIYFGMTILIYPIKFPSSSSNCCIISNTRITASQSLSSYAVVVILPLLILLDLVS